MLTTLTCALAALLAAGPSASQPVPDESSVHATLRIAGDRTSFKNGEPIRLELVFTSDKPGFVADTAGADDASDGLTISPEDSVHRLRGISGRDYSFSLKLSGTPTVVPVAVNYWVRFDRQGIYTVSLETARVRRAGADGFGTGAAIRLKTNPVTFRIVPLRDADEQGLIAAATQHLQSAIQLRGDRGLSEQIRAAEELAFLTGDAAALEKYRWYQKLGTVEGIASNARSILHRGFLMSRDPGVILGRIEAGLLDPTVAVTADEISNAAFLAVAGKHPEWVEPASWVPPLPNDSSPYSIERARYVALVHDSLERRTGIARLGTAGAILDVLADRTPADVVRLIVDGFDQLSPEYRAWLASGRWKVIRDPKLAPALRRALDEVEVFSRSYIYPALIDVAPELAVEPLARDILDPARIISDEIVAKMPRGSLSHVAPLLLQTIREMSKSPVRDQVRLDLKRRLLPAVDDGSLRPEDRPAIELRLSEWQSARQQRRSNGEELTKADESFESQVMRALVNSPQWTLSLLDRTRLLASCLTDACIDILRER